MAAVERKGQATIASDVARSSARIARKAAIAEYETRAARYWPFEVAEVRAETHGHLAEDLGPAKEP